MLDPLSLLIQKGENGTNHFYPYRQYGQKYILDKNTHKNLGLIYRFKTIIEVFALLILLVGKEDIGLLIGLPQFAILFSGLSLLLVLEFLFIRCFTRDLERSSRSYVRLKIKERFQHMPNYMKVIWGISVLVIILIFAMAILGSMGITLKFLGG